MNIIIGEEYYELIVKGKSLEKIKCIPSRKIFLHNKIGDLIKVIIDEDLNIEQYSIIKSKIIDEIDKFTYMTDPLFIVDESEYMPIYRKLIILK